MTDPKKKTAIAWPTAAVLLALIVGNVLIALLAPAADRLALMAAYSLTVGTVLAFMRGMLGGAALVLVLSLASGCGASAVQLHAEGAAIATVAVEGAQETYLAALDARQGACSDEACIAANRAEMRPAETALDVADAAVRAWRDAIEVALVAHESDALLSALMTAGLRVLARWADARTIAAPYGIILPELSLSGLGE